MRDLAVGEFLKQQRKVALVGGAGTGKFQLSVSIARACTRRGKRGHCLNVMDLVNKLDTERGPTAGLLCRRDFFTIGLERNATRRATPRPPAPPLRHRRTGNEDRRVKTRE